MRLRPIDHARSVLALTIITLSLAFWAVILVLLGCVKAVFGPARPTIDRMLDGCYRAAVAVDDACLRYVSGARWSTPDLALPKDELCLVVSNHASWADILLLQSAIARRGPLLKFLSKRELAWMPIFGVVFWAFDFPLLRRTAKAGEDPESRRAADAEALRLACLSVRRRPAALTNFAEGTRAHAEKIAAAEGDFRHVLPPRVGGFASLVMALEEDLASVVDVTIVSREPLSFWAFLSGRMPPVTVEAERIPAAQLPADREGLADWLRERWRVKDERLAKARGGD